MIVQSFSELKNGFEVMPGVTLLESPKQIEGEWRCLANVAGMLAVIVLKIEVVQQA